MMYYLSRMFEFEAAHRLSKHKGRCKNLHGHNWKVEVTVKSDALNVNSMVIDFGDLKKLVEPVMDKYDHRMLLNAGDPKSCYIERDFPVIFLTDGDPTSELLAKHIYNKIREDIWEKNIKTPMHLGHVQLHSITVWENDKSKVTYMEE